MVSRYNPEQGEICEWRGAAACPKEVRLELPTMFIWEESRYFGEIESIHWNGPGGEYVRKRSTRRIQDRRATLWGKLLPTSQRGGKRTTMASYNT